MKVPNSPKPTSQHGFTIMELLVATVVFAVILLVLVVGIVAMNNAFFKSTTQSTTQTVARSIIDEIAHKVEFSKAVKPLPSAGSWKGFCVDNVVYDYRLNQQVSDTQHALVRTDNGSCPASAKSFSATLPSGNAELISKNMRLGQLTVTEGGAAGNMYGIKVIVAYGDNDLLTDGGNRQPSDASFDWATAHCKSTLGEQFCAVSSLTTTVMRRL